MPEMNLDWEREVGAYLNQLGVLFNGWKSGEREAWLERLRDRWSADEVRIAVAEGYVAHELVVRHEMLHALLDREGHPPLYFQQRCALTWETWHG